MVKYDSEDTFVLGNNEIEISASLYLLTIGRFSEEATLLVVEGEALDPLDTTTYTVAA